MKKFFIFACALLAGCSKMPPHVDPAREEFATPAAAYAAALAHATPALGQFVIGPTNGMSMAPLTTPGDYLVMQQRAFSEVREGRIYGYEPSPADFPNLARDFDAIIVHRARLRDSSGWLMDGDNTPASDAIVRLTERNLIGECIFIAHVKH